MKYSPVEIAGLYCDRLDFYGLFYWYDAIVEINKPPAQNKK